MNKTITDNSSERIEVGMDADRFYITKSFKGHLPEDINDKKVTILNRAEGVRIYALLGKWLLTTSL